MQFQQDLWQIDGWQASSDAMAQEQQTVWFFDLFQAGEDKLVLFLARRELFPRNTDRGTREVGSRAPVGFIEPLCQVIEFGLWGEGATQRLAHGSTHTFPGISL